MWMGAVHGLRLSTGTLKTAPNVVSMEVMILVDYP